MNGWWWTAAVVAWVILAGFAARLARQIRADRRRQEEHAEDQHVADIHGYVTQTTRPTWATMPTGEYPIGPPRSHDGPLYGTPRALPALVPAMTRSEVPAGGWLLWGAR